MYSTLHVREVPTADCKYILFYTCDWLNPKMRNLEVWRADCIFIEKKSAYKWTHAVQTCIVQGAVVFGSVLRK